MLFRSTAKIADIDINIDSLKLKVNSDKLWNDFTSISGLDGGLVRNVPSITDNNTSTLFYDGYKGKVVGQLNAGQSRLISIDKY